MSNSEALELELVKLHQDLVAAETLEDFDQAELLSQRITDLEKLPDLERQKDEAKQRRAYKLAAELKRDIDRIRGGHKGHFGKTCDPGTCSHFPVLLEGLVHWKCCGAQNIQSKCEPLGVGSTFEFTDKSDDNLFCLLRVQEEDRRTVFGLTRNEHGFRSISCDIRKLTPTPCPWDPRHSGSFRYCGSDEPLIITGPRTGEHIETYCDRKECTHPEDFTPRSHFSCCGQSALDKPCVQVKFEKPPFAFNDVVLTCDGQSGIIVAIDTSDDYCYKIEEADGESYWASRAELQQVEPKHLLTHHGDFRDHHRAIQCIMYGPNAGKLMKSFCGTEAGEALCTHEVVRVEGKSKAESICDPHWSCCKGKLQDPCSSRKEGEPDDEADADADADAGVIDLAALVREL